MQVCNGHQELSVTLAVIERDTKANGKMLKDLVDTVKGNGKVGLITQSELNKSSINRAWWWLSGISMAILGVLVKSFL